MSYCRWSSDNFQCDLYCYESRDGYVTHVAACRYVGDIPKLPPLNDPGFMDAMAEQSAYLMKAELVPIASPLAGEVFTDPNLASFKERLLGLRAAGFNVPDYVLENIDEEMAQAAQRH